ncbi:hypothetical protein B0I31_1294 [Saccharothrix carnea]|uniref:Uncharacterized protein n=1 Tax=Saccharothrix carnea TaxID=1280637 RepID=A0A2P8HD47_SACCR|nr:hypothetical protein B0I31_1294 [Saccharothrix carnea]
MRGCFVHRLTAGDHRLLDVAVRTFRGIVVEDEVDGWVWGCRQPHVGGYSQSVRGDFGVNRGPDGR